MKKILDPFTIAAIIAAATGVLYLAGTVSGLEPAILAFPVIAGLVTGKLLADARILGDRPTMWTMVGTFVLSVVFPFFYEAVDQAGQKGSDPAILTKIAALMISIILYLAALLAGVKLGRPRFRPSEG
ncbi:MAG: hypothetical protein HY369_01400 [Candidatus Aenigmarchaeota archaeon]|nr:hypothetical protein [Candidatus Aenigmarchaeota archaeon]